MLLTCIALYLLLNLAVGLWASRRVKTTEDFVLAGRRLSFGLATMVTFATWFGSETMMGAPAQFVEGGLLAVIEEPFGAALCLILVGLVYAKIFYRLKIITFCDFFRNRFGRSAEVLSAALIVPSYFGWIAAQFVAMGVIGQVIFGVSLQTGILAGAGMVTLYTLTGGMWSVSITDFLHNLILIAGLGILTYLLLDQSGGLKQVLAAQPEGFFRFVPKTFSWQSSAEYFVAWATIGLGSIPQQDIFQRVMAAKNERVAVRASVTAGVLYLTVALLPLLIALMALRLYPELRQGDLKLIIPTMVLRHAPLLVQILFFGALVSALLSTASGAILAPAAVTGENLVKQVYPNLSDKQTLAVIRASVLGVSLASVWMALVRQDIFELVSESSAFSLVSLFVPMTAGLYWKRANRTGCLLSMALGWSVWFLCLQLGTTFPPVLYGLTASVLGLVGGTYLKQT
ncbi:MAG: sodium:solute symporter family protein [Cytophagaceae bacterium]|nr:sodium:solute symporter family protein [Cytophagaceae bacterium]